MGTVGSMKSEALTVWPFTARACPALLWSAEMTPAPLCSKSLSDARHLQDKPASGACCSERCAQGCVRFSPPRPRAMLCPARDALHALPGARCSARALCFSPWDAPFPALGASCFSFPQQYWGPLLQGGPRLLPRAGCPPWHLVSHMSHYFMGVDSCMSKEQALDVTFTGWTRVLFIFLSPVNITMSFT